MTMQDYELQDLNNKDTYLSTTPITIDQLLEETEFLEKHIVSVVNHIRLRFENVGKSHSKMQEAGINNDELQQYKIDPNRDSLALRPQKNDENTDDKDKKDDDRKLNQQKSFDEILNEFKSNYDNGNPKINQGKQ